ncbi:MAG: hypothetical protein LQ350_003708 [Teloschistes chrysophthalmus]|nr:MAG: hypothetical protein LQ350_003708 [Niorma chrysophthalma]
MNKDIALITALPAARRMEVFWRTFDRVLKGILFSKAANKTPEEGLHWAPRSFMGLQPWKEWHGTWELRDPREDVPQAVPTNAGLELALPGFTLNCGFVGRMGELDSTPHIIQDEEGIWYVIQLGKPWRPGSSVIDASRPLAIVIAYELEAKKKPHGRQLSDKFFTEGNLDGILVSTKKIENDVTYSIAHIHVAVQLLSHGGQSCLSIASRCIKNVDLQHSLLSRFTHEALKEKYRMEATQTLEDRATLDLFTELARYRGGDSEFENVLDALLSDIVFVAQYGDRSNVRKAPSSQMWCVD